MTEAMTVVKEEGGKRKEIWVAQVERMESGKHAMIWVNRLGTGKTEMEGVGDRRVVHRAAVGRGGLKEDLESLQDGLSSSTGTRLLGLGFQSQQLELHHLTPP